MQASELFSHWAQIRRDLYSIIDKFNEHELGYKPYSNSWSVGEIILHIASAEEGWFGYVIKREYDHWPEDYQIEDHPSKELLKYRLEAVHQSTIAFLEKLNFRDLEERIEFPWDGGCELSWIIWHVLEHEIHHRGELSLILGLLGREGLDV